MIFVYDAGGGSQKYSEDVVRRAATQVLVSTGWELKMPKQDPRTPIKPPRRTLFDYVALVLALATIVAISSVAVDMRSPSQHWVENR